ncbi:hypothetical protein FOZ63_003243 [Perkinsus olseni]|uniref:DUF7164 domain-containing protein n=2 Tax=Perkinsus olseni TaxID=32597 RepID=A0A7J6U2Y0_PEROL|nr:hypothetical protein FOZ63_003243 [Perkinsus olseni]
MSHLIGLLFTVALLYFLFQSSVWTALQPHEHRLRGLPVSPSGLLGLVGSANYWQLNEGRDILKSRVAEAAASLDAVVGDLGEPLDFRANTTTRAVMAFLPTTPPPHFRRELRALYLSWIFMKFSGSDRLRTDLVIFTAEEGKQVAEDIGCSSEPRRAVEEPSRCIIVDYVPLADRPTPHGEPVDPLRGYTAYVDCMLTIAEYQGYEYDFVLRTDLDTFLMPGFADWLPKNPNQLVVGWGGYSSKNAELHLKYVTETLGLRDKEGMTSLGSTWYGNLRLFKASANLTLAVIRWLLTQEFSEFERCCSEVESWPHWHRAVALLYGGHVALNHIGDNVLISGAENGFMDFESVKTEPITNKQIKHVHCWHTRELFSKFEFHEGAYDQLDLTPFLDMSTTRDYVVTLAVSSVRLSDSELANLSSNTDLLRNRSSWLRLPDRNASNGVKIYVE